MKHEGLFWLRVAAAAVAIGAVITGLLRVAGNWDTVAMGALFVFLIASIAVRMPGERDYHWLPPLVVTAFFVKLAGSYARWYMVDVTYDQTGDSFAYHNRALPLADVWRTFSVPDLQVGSSGTTVASQMTGLLYSVHKPSEILGGFFIFATVAFLGQLLFYAAFRRAMPGGRLKLYAVAVLLLPSIVFWPSSIGKESLMLFFIGLAAFGAAGLFADYRIRWLLPTVAGLAGAGAIRLHVAALLAVAIAAATFLTRRPGTGPARARRVVMLGLAGVAVVLLITLTSETFGIDPSGNDIDPFLDEIQRRTQQGGSAVEGEAVRGIAAIPDATLRVLFRPLPHEANSFQAYLSAMESVLILAVIVWRLPQTLRSFRRIRRNPYLLFSMLFVIGFVIVFSAIFNLGILARQRTQALPFLLALIVGMGWEPETEPDETVEPQLVRTR